MLARLTQQLLSQGNARAGVVEIHEADPAWFGSNTHPAFDTSGLWIPAGVIEPKSLKPQFDQKFFDLKTGFPATVKKSWVVDMDGKISFNLEEVTAAGIQMAAGGAQAVRMYSAAGSTTVTANVASGAVTGINSTPSGTPYVITSLGDMAATFTAAPAGGTTATVGLELDSNGQLIVTLLNPGKGYIANPTLTITQTTATFSAGTAADLPTYVGLVSTTSTQFTVASATGFAVGDEIEVQLDSPGATINFGDSKQAYTGLATTYITAISGNTFTCYPLLPAIPLVTTGTVKRIGGMVAASGTAVVRQKSYRIVFFADDGSQLVSYIPLARSAGGVKFDYQDASKNALVPVELMAFGVPIAATDPWFGTSHPGEPILAYHYLLKDQNIVGATYQTGQPLAV